jgi:nitric oxide reductase NorE protein
VAKEICAGAGPVRKQQSALAPQSGRPEAGRIPGDPGVWVLICGDLFVFSAFFLYFVVARSHDPNTFAAAHTHLDRRIGLTGSLLLLSSSLFVALGIHRLRDRNQGARLQFGIAIALGIGFVICKLAEYSLKIHQGITPLTNDFFMYYFAFTLIHLVHVLIGLGILMLMRSASAPPVAAQRMLLIESGALFWHVVDLLWIVLFALFYLLGG